MAELKRALLYLTRSHFDDTLHLYINGGHSKRFYVGPQLHNTQFAVQSNDVNREAHPHSMNAGRGINPYPSSGLKSVLSKKAKQPRKRSICAPDATADDDPG